MHRTLDRVFLFGAIVLVGGGLVLGFMKLGSPAKNRMIALDDRRIMDLYNIANAVVGTNAGPKEGLRPSVATATAPLPASIEEIKERSPYSSFATSDPSGNPYTYRTTGTSTFELCATFEIERKANEPEKGYAPSDYAFWDHPAGKHCFQFSGEKYPPYYYYNHSYRTVPSPAFF